MGDYMSKKFLILIFILLAFIGSLSVVSSASINIEDIAIPSGFSVDNVNESQLSIYNDVGYTTYYITITSEDYRSPEEISDSFKENGFNLQGTDSIKLNNKDIKEENYIYKTNGYVYNYIIQLGDKKYSVSCLTDSETWDINSESNPVNKILNSMIECSTR